MANLNGSAYGLTILCPIVADDEKGASPITDLRDYLRILPRGTKSPFCKVPETHLARLSIIDDVFFEGTIAKEDHLKSKYLWFNTNFDGDVVSYLESMYSNIPAEIEKIWHCCIAFPGIAAGREKWKQYMLKCQVDTTFFFAAVNDMSVEEMLRALMLKQEFSAFVASHQGRGAPQLKKDFIAFMKKFEKAPTPLRGSTFYHFDGQGG